MPTWAEQKAYVDAERRRKLAEFREQCAREHAERDAECSKFGDCEACAREGRSVPATGYRAPWDGSARKYLCHSHLWA